MTSVPLPFQEATVAAALACLTGGGSRRFLVADEVGLGKTTVAREVVRRLSEGGSRRMTVFYVTSNTRVSDQNASRLVDFLEGEAARKAALSKVDRLSLIPLAPPSGSPLRLYSLAPLTSFPPETTRPNGGTALERAFLGLLLEAILPGINEVLPNGFMQQRAAKTWHGAIQAATKLMAGIEPRFLAAYHRVLRDRFGTGPKAKIVDAASSQAPARTLAILRRLLAEACLAGTPPDLVIFDEFQKFRGLLAPGPDDQLARALLGAHGTSPPMLLLSATPYRLYGDSWDAKDGQRAHEELFETIEFLTGSKDVRERAENAFSSFGDILRVIGEAADDTIDPVLKARAEDARDRIDAILRPHIARTERPQSERPTVRKPIRVEVIDLRMFKHFASQLAPRNQAAASAYWLSIPLPAQALGTRYKITEKVSFVRTPGLPRLGAQRRLGPASDGWGSPKLRALQKLAPTKDLALPWVAPSMPWWPLAGPWRDAPSQKTLLFSRFRVTPQSVAALVSSAVETAYLDANPTARRNWDSKRLTPQSGLPVMGLFHPSPFLVRETDPLEGGSDSPANALRTVRRQLRAALRAIGIEIRTKRKKDACRARPIWNLLAAIEARSGDFESSQSAWSQATGSETVLQGIVEERCQAEDVEWIGKTEFERLTEMALAGPAVVVGRALYRHFPAALDPVHLHRLMRFCWYRLRPYLDNKVFWGRLGDGKSTKVLQTAVVHGGFESVLDEHFWLALGQTERSRLLDDLGSALHASLGWFTFKGLPATAGDVRLRCHAAVPFGGTERSSDKSAARVLAGVDDEAPPRSEELRRAFNTPFWPHVLTTTSTGQEGLDFHSWCRRIVHWDLPSSPVDLEQREGRISRYGGLLVRRPLGESVRSEALAAAALGGSPWMEAAKIARERYRDLRGLSPWWSLDGADVDRHVLALSKSRDVARFAHLQRQRLLYRLALGQPNQEDLVNSLARGSDQKISELRALALDLSPNAQPW